MIVLKIWWCFSCVYPVIDHDFCPKIVEVDVVPLGDS